VRAPVLLLPSVRTIPPGLFRCEAPQGSASYPGKPRLDRLNCLPKRCCRLNEFIETGPRFCCYVTVRVVSHLFFFTADTGPTPGRDFQCWCVTSFHSIRPSKYRLTFSPCSWLMNHINKWMNGWMDEWMNEWMNAWMKEWTPEWSPNRPVVYLIVDSAATIEAWGKTQRCQVLELDSKVQVVFPDMATFLVPHCLDHCIFLTKTPFKYCII
jgi:hypothetical protein